jgi:hypothetical protein
MDVTNLSAEQKKAGIKINVKPERQSNLEEVDCKIILSPPGFRLFDVEINRALNEQSPLFQELKSSVKVVNHIRVVFSMI